MFSYPFLSTSPLPSALLFSSQELLSLNKLTAYPLSNVFISTNAKADPKEWMANGKSLFSIFQGRSISHVLFSLLILFPLCLMRIIVCVVEGFTLIKQVRSPSIAGPGRTVVIPSHPGLCFSRFQLPAVTRGLKMLSGKLQK